MNSKKKKSEHNLKLWWFRYPHDPSASITDALKRPKAYAVVGGTGAGKSALVEVLEFEYAKRGGVILDLFGSRDNEGLAWLRSPFKKDVLLLKGNSAQVDCNCADVMNASDFSLKAMKKYTVVVSVASFYSRVQEEWYALTKIMDKLWHRQHWIDPWCLGIREASSLLYSRLALGDTQAMAKNYLIYVIKEMRHCGFAVALDTIRWMGIDIDMRTIADYTFIKAQGIDGLPSSLRFLYRYFKPSGVMRCPVNAYSVVSREGPLGFGISRCPKWHKEEYENLLSMFDINISYKELPHIPEGKMAKVGDYEHLRIIKARIKMKGKGGEPLGMEEMGKRLGRSSGTIFRHITTHNNRVHSVGICDKCERVGSELAKVAVD